MSRAATAAATETSSRAEHLAALTCPGASPELVVSLDDAFALGAEDRKLLAQLIKRTVITAAAAKKLAAKLRASSARRDWILGHGVERLFGFPEVQSAPVRSAARKPARQKAAAVDAQLTDRQRAVVADWQRRLAALPSA